MRPQRPLIPSAQVGFAVRPCPCDRGCGGLLVRAVATDDSHQVPWHAATDYEHLSIDEVWDVLDAYVYGVGAG